MAGYVSILSKETKELPVVARSKKAVPKGGGCSVCPLESRGAKLIQIKKIKQRQIMVWGQSPDKGQCDGESMWAGPVGRFISEELDAAGIDRRDCDIQNVVRCRPTVTDIAGVTKDRAPDKKEIAACSYHTARALEVSGARVHLVLGTVAGKALLGNEYKKNKAVFWSDKLSAWVVCVDHPMYFIRGGSNFKLGLLRERLKMIPSLIHRKSKYAYLEEQDYKLVKHYKTARKVIVALRRRAARNPKQYFSIDIEEGIVDPETRKAADEGVRVLLVLGISDKAGRAYVFAVDHPENDTPERNRRRVKSLLKKFLEDPAIKKSMHYGVSDSLGVQGLIGAKVRGYSFDTNYSTYLKWPAQKAYGLDEQSRVRVPEFSGYKEMIKPYLNPRAPNFATIPLRIMKLYNGGDSDLTIRLTDMTLDKKGPLLNTYVKVAYVLKRMESTGPYFDHKWYDKVVYLVPQKLESTFARLKVLANDPEYNPDSPTQVAKILYDKFKLPLVSKDRKGNLKRATDKTTLKLYATMNIKDRHKEFCEKHQLYKKLSKMESTYLSNYRESAEVNDGQLRTIWWLTGTITGRLSSGGGSRPGIVNMQNLHGDKLLLNLLVSDLKWRLISKYFKDPSAELWRRVMRRMLFVAADYSQIEIRMLAEMSGDPILISHFTSGEDLHAMVGHTLTGRPLKDFADGDLRRMIKALHFGIIYGMQKPSLFKKLISEGVKVTRSQSDGYYDQYFKKYRKVAQFIEYMRKLAERQGYTETLFQFRRPIFAGDNVADDGRESYWGNQAINSPIQGSAHQLMLFAMAILHDHPEKYPALSHPVMEVHDALDFYTPVRDLAGAYTQLKHLLEVGVVEYIKKYFKMTLKVPLLAEIKAGPRLGVLKEYKGGSRKSFLRDWVAANKKVDAEVLQKWAA